MPRLLAPDYVHTETMDDSLNEYMENAGKISFAPAHQNLVKKSLLSNTFTTYNSHPLDTDDNTKETSTHLEQQIHSISSSDEEFVNERNIIDEKIPNMSSEDSSDFEGFDDYTTINSNGLIYETSRENFNTLRNNLEANSHTSVSEHNAESEDYIEAVEVENEDEEIGIGEDGKIIYRSTGKVTPKRSQTYRSEPCTPNKRKKELNDENYIANSPTQLKTTPDQIVEVNSDSTTNSLKQKRLQINNKFQLNLSQQQNYKININPNKCSTESTSEFPVSSPSNPQQARGGKYLARPPLLKNTLPADSFERQLAMITTCNPQMTLAEKIQSWDCEEEPSDLEDVKKFDEEFKRLEKQKKLEMKQREKDGRTKNSEYKNYDFLTFQKMILKNIEEQKHQKYKTNSQSVGGGIGASGGKGAETSGSESSKSVVHVDDRPSTSAVAQQQLQQRRSKHHLLCFEAGESKKRVVKDVPKRNQNSTTPPQTSSSENERDCFNNTKNNTVTPTYDTLICGSSSEETISQDISRNMQPKGNNKYAQIAVKNLHKKSLARPILPDPKEKLNEKRKSKNCRTITNEEIQSFFRPNRLNREIDKYDRMPINKNDEQSTSIIQMRLDFTNKSKTELLSERKQELFKTPIVPQKYLPNPLITTDYQGRNIFSATINEKTTEDVKKESPTANSLKKVDEINNKVLQDKVEINPAVNDMDGVYHQQHEFCNYLGLTGMSTATAMANAVAELAQCNLARRSMRVLRQQQQERREKSAKEERLQEALKLKQLKEVRKREKRRCDIIPAIDAEQVNVLRSDEGTHSQTSEPAICFVETEKKVNNNSAAKSSTKSRNSNDALKKEPEIKILCHIAAKDKEEADKPSPECTKGVPQPIRETLLRVAKQRNSDTPTGLLQNSKEISNKNFQINISENNDSVDEISLVEKENILRSPILSTGKSLFKNTRSRSQVLCEEMIETAQTQEPILASNTGMATRMIDNIDSSSQNSTTEDLNKDEIFNEENNARHERLFKEGIQLISSAPSIIQKKIQMALEESRKSKPSIFIVQSLESKKEKMNNLCKESEFHTNNFDSSSLPPKTLERQEINIDREYPRKSSTKYTTNYKRRAFKTRKIKKYPICKRQLRKRKIILIKTLKSKHKSHESLNAIKRELRSSLRTNENKRQNCLPKKKENLKQKPETGKVDTCNEAKSFRTVHTETKDLELYLHKNNNQTKKRLMAKASALLERSRRMTLRGNCNLVNKTKFSSKIPRSQHSSHDTTETCEHIRGNGTSESKKKLTLSKVQQLPRKEQKVRKQTTTKPNQSSSAINLLENENVVVSSTTNTYDEKPSYETLATPSPTVLTTLNNTASYVTGSPAIKTKDQQTQCSDSCGVHYLNTPPLPIQVMRNPLKSEHGAVLYIYNELDVLIVIQDHLVSFWKCSKLINILLKPNKLAPCTHQTVQNDETTLSRQNVLENCCNNQLGPESSVPIELNDCSEWIQLGELRRLNLDIEICAPYANRICLHNSTPIYLEMRAQQLPKNQRECNLLSIYINIYYYHDEDMIAKCNSIPLDSIQSDVKSVNYTTLTDSRYFIITWPQENLLGKTRSGLCKYSLTPQLDTLASIREFKSMRHTIRYLECMSDDKLIGFGETQVSIWDFRSGDVLMNFDFEIPMGKNLGFIYFSSQDIEQNNMLILHQFRDLQNIAQTELMTIACTVTHSQPSYKVLQATNLPTPAFKLIKSAIKTGDHLVLTGQNDDELWISLTNPRLRTVIPNMTNTKRFYCRERSQLIELTENSLNVNSLANHVLQLAAGLTLK